jgi:hypothetical protein
MFLRSGMILLMTASVVEKSDFMYGNPALLAGNGSGQFCRSFQTVHIEQMVNTFV